MPPKRHSSRKREIQEILVDMRPGCLLGFVLALGIPFVGLGGFFLYLGVADALRQARLNTSAAEAPAIILSSDMLRPVGARSGTTSFFADIEFSYDYEGVTWKSDRIWPVAEAGKESEIQASVDRFPADGNATAFVDPENPEFAFLEKRWSSMVYISICLGCLPVTFVTMLILFLIGWKQPQLSLMIAVVVSVVVASGIVLAGSHFSKTVPPEHQVSWIWWILTATGLFAFSPLLTLRKVNQLNNLYQ